MPDALSLQDFFSLTAPRITPLYALTLLLLTLYWWRRVAREGREGRVPRAAWWSVPGLVFMLFAPILEQPTFFGVGAFMLLFAEFWPGAYRRAQRPGWWWPALGALLGTALLVSVMRSTQSQRPALAASLALLGRVADRVHPRRALTPGLLLLAVTFTLVAFSDTPPVQQRLWFLATLLGAAYGAFIAGWNGLVGRTLPETHRAAGWGTVMTVESLGYAIGPLLGGVTWQLAGQRGVFLLGAAVFVLTELYYLWPARQVIRQTEPQPK
mgnify:CR=1 FL=1